MSKTILYMSTLKDILERTLDYNTTQLKRLPKGTLITNVSRGLSYLYWSRASKKKPEKPKKNMSHPDTLTHKNSIGEDNLEKIRDYLKAGYTYGKDLMFIFENTKGIDLAAIARIIDMLIA